MIHGHAHPAIMEAVTAQLQRGTAFGSPLELQTTLARLLCARVPSVDLVRFCNSGTEATLNAIRAAKAYTGRAKVLKMEGGYHGSHDAVEVSVSPPAHDLGPAHAPHSVPDCPGLFTAITQDVLVAPFNDIAATESIIAAHAGDLAAVIVEPVLGSAGVIPATREYLQALKVACESSGALLIFDEVVTLRLAVGGAQSLYGVTPDLTAMGKIIGGGFPIGAFGGRAEVMAQYDPTQHRLHQGGTYNGNAVSMVAGKVALELLDAAEIDRLNRLGDGLRSQLNAVLASSGLQGHVAGIGSLLQLHLGAQAPVRHYRDTLADEKRAHEAMHLALLNHGFFGAKRGEYALSTPMTEADTALAVQRFRAALGDLDRRGRAGEAS
jgi:glutamate-1-semialdehyde 2,1-aminomutase